jgi:hypothetical protein
MNFNMYFIFSTNAFCFPLLSIPFSLHRNSYGWPLNVQLCIRLFSLHQSLTSLSLLKYWVLHCSYLLQKVCCVNKVLAGSLFAFGYVVGGDGHLCSVLRFCQLTLFTHRNVIFSKLATLLVCVLVV